MALSIGHGITISGGITFSPVYTVVTDGLVFELDAGNSASYPGTGNNWYDLVGSDDATLPNGATYSSSNSGILTFNRSLSQSAHAASLGSALTTFTAEIWVKFNNLSLSSGNATCTITEVYASTPINYTIGTGMLGNTVVWQGGYYGGAGDWHLAGNLVPVVNTWYCMTVTYDGAYVKFYVNGELNDTVTSAVTPVSSGQGIHIGERWDAPYYTESYVDGSIPIARLYNRALSATEVLTNYRANQARFTDIVTNGLSLSLDAGNPASYPGSGTTWTDTVGGIPFTLVNGPTYNSGNGGYIQFTPASGQYARSYSNLGTLAAWSIEAWHYYDGTNTSSGPNIFTEYQYAGGTINLGLGSNSADTDLAVWWYGGGFHTTNSGYSLTPGAWYQIVGTFDGSTLKLYVNNTLVQTKTGESPGGAANPSIGYGLMTRWDPGGLWGGRLAIVNVYNSALTDAEVSQNFDYYRSRFGI